MNFFNSAIAFSALLLLAATFLAHAIMVHYTPQFKTTEKAVFRG